MFGQLGFETHPKKMIKTRPQRRGSQPKPKALWNVLNN